MLSLWVAASNSRSMFSTVSSLVFRIVVAFVEFDR